MFDFGGELIIESYRFPWLIWIQILVMLLLMLLLYCLSLFALDLPIRSSSGSASLCPDSLSDKHKKVGLVSTCFQSSQVGETESIKGVITKETSGRVVSGEDDINVEKEGSSSKEVNQYCYHPCHYLRLAKLAFLQCLGLDFLSESCSTSEQRNQR